ncbi:hypothetical protein DTO212C5_8345 [Paecilomyces variotii]|nr:hypothetical protein DTO169E5_5856 [Paecilomyces variotii]KAJ9261305.1 hypothetical protein DTO212C5_8345 [Paecilomyces variotii]
MTVVASQQLPVLLRVRSSTVFIVTAVAIAVFTDTFLYGLLIPVFPSALQERCSVPESKVQMYTSYLVGLTGAGNLIGAFFFGWLADHTSNRRFSLLLSLSVLTVATVLIWIAHNVAILYAGRFLQGLASAAVWSVGLALLVDTVGKREIPVVMGYVNVAFSAGTVTGPFVGGIVYSLAGYDATLGLAVGLLGLDIILRLLIVEKRDLQQILESSAVDEANEDVVQPLLGTPTASTNNRHTQTSYSSTLPATQENQEDEGTEVEVAYKTLINSKRLVVLLVCAIVQAITMSSFEVTLPLHLRDIFNYDPKGAGLAFIPLMVPAFFSPAIGYVCDRVGNKIVAFLGYILCAVALVLLRLPTHKDTLNEVGMFGDLLMIGTAMCMTMTPVLTEIFVAVEDLEEQKPGRFGPYGAYAQAYGLFEFVYSAGILGGPIMAGWLRTSFSWNALTLVLGILSFATSFLMIPTKWSAIDDHDEEETR